MVRHAKRTCELNRDVHVKDCTYLFAVRKKGGAGPIALVCTDMKMTASIY